MKRSVCECAEVRRKLERERERERNSPGGLIVSLFVICFQFFITGYAIAKYCPNEVIIRTEGTHAPNVWDDVFVVKYGNSGNYYYEKDNCKPGGEWGNSYNENKCYISYAGYGDPANYASGTYYYANTCGSNCEYHVERYGTCSSMLYQPVANQKNCNGFDDIRIYDNYDHSDTCNTGDNCTQLLIDDISIFGKNFGVSDIISNDEWTNQAFFAGMKIGSLYIGNGQTCHDQGGAPFSNYCHFDYSVDDSPFYKKAYTWDTRKCHFNNNVYNVVYNHCRGHIKWSAEDRARGDAAHGFYLSFVKEAAQLKKSEDSNEPCVCEPGWLQSKPEDTNGPRECNTCDTAGHWKCSGDTASCVYGYYQSGTGESAICNLKQNFECTDAAQNVCYCKSGFVLNNTGQCGGASANQCKTNFQYENGECVCNSPFVLNTYGDNNPENDTCDFDTVKTYTDDTGTFTLISEEPDCPAESAP